MEQNLDRAEAIIDAYGCDQSNLIAIMQEIQGEYKYLSEGADPDRGKAGHQHGKGVQRGHFL